MPEVFTQDPPAWVRPYLGIPYAELDCWHLASRMALERTGRALPSFDGDYEVTADPEKWDAYVREQVTALFDRELQDRTRWPRVEVPEPLDLVLYRVLGRYHVATVVGGGWAVTTNLARGSHPVRMSHPGLKPPFLGGYYRHAGTGG